MKTKRFSLITILAVILLAFTTLFGISLKSDKASADSYSRTGNAYADALVETSANMDYAYVRGTQYQLDSGFTASPRTIEALFRLGGGTNWNWNHNQGCVIGGVADGATNQNILNIEINSAGNPRFYWNTSGTLTDETFSNVVIPTQEWVHLVIVRDTNNIKCYVNGELKQTITKTAGDFGGINANNPTVAHYIGRDGRTANYFCGEINYVGVSSTAISQSDISKAYNTDKARVVKSGATGTMLAETCAPRTYYRASTLLTGKPTAFTATINIPKTNNMVHRADAETIGKILSTYSDGGLNMIEMAVDNNGHIKFTWDTYGHHWDRIDGYFDTAISNDLTNKLDVRTGQDVHIALVKDNTKANPFSLYIDGIKVAEASYYFYYKGAERYMNKEWTEGATKSERITKLWDPAISIDAFLTANEPKKDINGNALNFTLNTNPSNLFRRISTLFYNYKDNKEDPPFTIDFVPNFAFAIGEDVGGEYQIAFPGKIKDVAIYSEIIDVAAEYAVKDKKTINKATSTDNSFTGRESVLANWVLDESQQSFKYNKNNAHDVKDYSGNGIDAFLCTLGNYLVPETNDWFVANDDEYTLIYVPDTQITANYVPSYIPKMFKWMVDNKDAMNLQFVMGLGDIIDGAHFANYINQWETMAAAYKSLSNAGIYWSAITGNHDYDNNSLGALTVRDADDYNNYFGYNSTTLNDKIRDSVIARFSTNNATAGTAIAKGDSSNNDMLNVIYEYTATTNGGTQVKYLVVALEFGPSPETLAWATSVISQPQYANHRVLFNTHSLIYADGYFGDGTAETNPVKTYWTGLSGNNVATDGDYMWENFISRNPNMFLTASGHIETDTNMFRTDTGVYGNTVLSMLCDGQGVRYHTNTDPLSGTGDTLILIARVNEKTKTIKYYYYNPVNNMMFGAENQWEYDFSNALQKANYYNEAIKNIELSEDGKTASFEIDKAYYTYAEPYITNANGGEIEWIPSVVDGITKYTYEIPTDRNLMPLSIDVKAVTLAKSFKLMEGETKDIGVYLPKDFTFTVNGTALNKTDNIISFKAVGTDTITIRNAKGNGVLTCSVTTEKQAIGSFSRFNELVKDFKMDEIGARFRLMWTQFNCGITYIGSMPTELAQMVTPKLIFVPQKNIDNLKAWANSPRTDKPGYVEGGKYILGGDYVAGLEAAGLIPKEGDPRRDEFCLNAYTQTEGDTTYLVGGVKNITNVADANKKWFVIYYFEYLGHRYYAELPYGSEANSSRSIAYVTSALVGEKGYNNLDTNAKTWIDYFTDNAITDALNKSNDTKNNAELRNKVKENLTKVFVDGNVTATYYDDLLTNNLYIEYQDTEKSAVDVTGLLDFKVNWSNATNILSLNGGFITTNKVGTGTITAQVGKWAEKENLSLTVSAFNLSADVNKPYVELAVPDQGYDSGDTPTAFEPIAELTIKPNNNKRIFTKSFTDVKPEYDQNKSNNLTDGVGEGTVTVTGENYDFDEETQTPNVTGSVSANFAIKADVYKLTIKYKHTSGADVVKLTGTNNGKPVEDAFGTDITNSDGVNQNYPWTESYIYLPKGVVYYAELQTTEGPNKDKYVSKYYYNNGDPVDLTITSGYSAGAHLSNAIEKLRWAGDNAIGKPVNPDRWWIGGVVEGDQEIVITYSNTDRWDGTDSEATGGFAGGTPENPILYNKDDKVHGTKDNPYKIQTAEQLAYLAKVSNEGETYTDKNGNGIYDAGDVLNDKNGNGEYDPGNLVKVGNYYEFGKGQYFELVNSIELNMANGSTNYLWTPICYSSGSYDWHYFAGNFNGNGFGISGIKIENESVYGVGLFGGIVGTVENLTIQGKIKAGHRAGGLAYTVADNAVIENVRSYVDVTTTKIDNEQTSYASGLIGISIETTHTYPINKTQVVNCENYGKITAPGYTAAGIVGHIYGAGSAIINCSNYGQITGGAKVGGIVADFTQMVKGCANYGTICGNAETGFNLTDTVEVDETEYSFGVKGYYVGGIFGRASSGATLEDSVNYGAISGAHYVGGLIGFSVYTAIYNSNNFGSVNGEINRAENGQLMRSFEAQASGVTSAAQFATLISTIEGKGTIGNICGVKTKSSTISADSTSQVVIKFNFVNEKGEVIFDYKSKAVEKGTYVDRDTTLWVGLTDPTRIMTKYDNVGYGEKVDNVEYVNDGPLEGLIELVNYHINKQYGGNYLPNMFWWSGIVEKDTVIDITFTEADVWDGTIVTNFAGGAGTQANPFLISTGEQLARLAELVNSNNSYARNAYYKLTNSINLNGIEWTPIGQSLKAKYDTENHWSNNTAVFSGNFDGNGYTIGGLKTTNQGGNESFVGLFGYVSNNNKEIKDLVIQGEVAGFLDVGGLAGDFQYGTAKNVTTFVDVSSDVYFAWGAGYWTATTGGIAGGIDNGATILNCVNYGDVTTNGNNVGGIVGNINSNNSTQSNVLGCVNYGNVTAGTHVGGIAGYVQKPNVVYNNTNYGDVTGSSNVGGIIGTMINGSSESNNTLVSHNGLENPKQIAIVTENNVVTDKKIGRADSRTQIDEKDYYVLTINYYVDNELYSSKYLALEKGYFGRSAEGNFTSSLVATGYSSETTVASDLALVGYLPDRLWVAGYITEDIVENVYYSKVAVERYDNNGNPVYTWDGSIATSFAGGIGTETNPYLIENGAQLAYLAKLFENKPANFGGNTYFKLVNSIDLGGNYWTPIGYRDFNDKIVFEGNFDGNGKTIANLKIANGKGTTGLTPLGGNGAGLFQCFAGTATNLTVAGNISSTGAAGGFCASLGYELNGVRKNGKVDNVLSFVDVSITSNDYVLSGAFVGYTHSSDIFNCANYGNITADASGVGGVVGGLYGASTMYNTVNYGHVKGTTTYSEPTKKYANGAMIGAASSTLEGELRTRILDCVNYGSISAMVENVAGVVATFEGNAEMANVKNYGAVNGYRNVGGIVGIQKEQTSSTTSITYTNASLSILNGEYYEKYNGTYIENYGDVTAELQAVGGIVGSLSAGSARYTKNYGTIKTNYGVSGGIVGQLLTNNEDGLQDSTNNGQIILDATYDASGNEKGYNIAGIVGRVEQSTGTLVNLTGLINNGNVSAPNTNNVAGIVGEIRGKYNVDSIENTGVIEGRRFVGGFAGIIQSSSSGTKINNTTNYGNLTANNEGVGGIIGCAGAAEVHLKNLSTRNATIFSNGNLVGGIIGYASGQIKGIDSDYAYNLIVEGTDITGKDGVGGIIGQVNTATAIANLDYTRTENGTDDKVSSVTGNFGVGGFIGSISQGATVIIKDDEGKSQNNANVTGTKQTGGIVGLLNKANDSNSVLREPTLTINNVINNASVKVTASENAFVGGIVGKVHSSTNSNLTNVTNNGVVTKANDNNPIVIGGIVGGLESGAKLTITNPINKATVSGADAVGGIVGLGYGTLTINGVEGTDTNQGAVNGRGAVAGIVGQVNGGTTSLTDVNNKGDVEAQYYVGGIVGLATNASILNITNANNSSTSINSTRTSNTSAAGGIVGYVNTNATADIDNVINTASITGHNAVGGIVGCSVGTLNYTEPTGKEDATTYASQGAVTGNAAVAGIVGQISGGTATITAPRNCGDIKANLNKAGGVVGQVNNATLTIQNAYNRSTITGPNIVGGIVAYIESATVSLTNVTNAKDITSAGSQIGGIVGYNKSNTTSLSVTTGSNKNSITGATKVGGLIGDNDGTVVLDQVNVIGTSSITIQGTTDTTGNSEGDSNVGGMVGESSGALYIIGSSNSSVTCVGSTNASIKTLITAPDRNVGGVVGYASGKVMLADAITFKNGNETITDKKLINSTTTATHGGSEWGLALNNTSVIGSQDVGGVIGDFNGETITLDDVSIINNSSVHAGTKNGNTIATYNSVAGGYIGRVSKGTVNIIDTTNETETLQTSAIVSGKDSVGGFVGCIDSSSNVTIKTTVNGKPEPISFTGTITAPNGYVGGIIGHVSGTSATIVLNNVKNQAAINSTAQNIGGIIGRTVGNSVTLTNVTNSGQINNANSTYYVAKRVGGLIGIVESGTTTINSGTYSNATVRGAESVGGIVGQVGSATTNTEGDVIKSGSLNINTSALSTSAKHVGVSATSDKVGGIIGWVVSAGSINISNVTTLADTIYGKSLVGGLIGKAGADKGDVGTSNNVYNGTITINNVTNNGQINSQGDIVGGFIGWDKLKTTITNSSNAATVSTTQSYVGGIIGTVGGGILLDISNTTNSAEIITTKVAANGDALSSGSIGGIIGYILSSDANSKLTGVTNSGTINAGSANCVGGIIGRNSGNIIISGGSKNTGTLFGAFNVGQSVGLSVWDGTIPNSVGALDNILDKDASGNYLIHTAQDLAELSKASVGQTNYGSDKTFKLMSNVDLQEGGWVPISYYYSWGNSPTISSFGGTFDGLNHTVTFEESFVSRKAFFGLFGGIGSATIKNLKLAGSFDNVFYTGGLVSTIMGNNALIDNVDSSISIIGDGDNTNLIVGGIIGQILSDVTGLTIQNCDNSGAISVKTDQYMVENNDTDAIEEGNAKTSYRAAGIIALVNPGASATIRNCTNTGNITNKTNNSAKTATDGSRTGGIVGDLLWWASATSDKPTLTIENCSNSGVIVAGGSSTGGIIGYSKGNLTINNVNNTKNVTGTTNVGGIVGLVDSQSTIQESGLTNSGTIKGNSNATTNVGTASPWVGYIIGRNAGTSVWNGTYPNVASGYTFEGEGTSSSPYLIQSAQDLAGLSRLSWAQSGGFGSGDYYKQMVNIDLSVGNWKGICDYNATGWVGADVTTWGFDGAYNGNNKIINMKETAGKNWTGLFWAIKNGTVQNLTLEGTITAGSYSGALAARVCGTATISGITNNIDITRISSSTDPNNYIGMIGYIGTGLSGTITIQNCINNGAMDGDANIADTDSKGPKGNVIGGIVGGVPWQSSSTLVLNITNCTNTGNISGLDSVAGIIGSVSQKTTCNITNCTNSGEITGRNNVGGIIGHTIATTTINGSTNTGTISAGSYVGGLVGLNSGTLKIGNTATCSNTGAINATGYHVGGLVGLVGAEDWGTPSSASLTIGTNTIACSNTGNVTGRNNVGGIVGSVNRGTTVTIKKTSNGTTNAQEKNTIKANDMSAGGIIGAVASRLEGDTTSIVTIYIISCNNNSMATINAVNGRAGGLVGGSNAGATINVNLTNSSITGAIQKNGVTLNSPPNDGTSANGYLGLYVGYAGGTRNYNYTGT